MWAVTAQCIMMETMMDDNPEMMAQVMDNFMQEDFDIFSHMAEPTYDDPTMAYDRSDI